MTLILDVSRFGGVPDYRPLRDRGAEGVIIRGASGPSHRDTLLDAHLDAAARAGVRPIAIYAYCYSWHPGEVQAAHAVTVAAGVGLPVAVDFEKTMSGPPRPSDEPAAARVTALAWLRHHRASVPPGFALHVLGCLGDGDPLLRCSAHADRWKDHDGQRLPAMRKHFKLHDDARPILAAYSAGGQCVRRLLLDPRDRAEIAGVYLADATYGAWAQPGIVAVDELQEALVSMALECAEDGRPFVATASAHVPGGGGPSGSVTLAMLRREIEAQQGWWFAEHAGDALAGLPTPETAHRGGDCGRVLFVDFGTTVPHVEHATKIAGVLLPRVVS